MLNLCKPQQLLVSAFLIIIVVGAYTSVFAQWEGWAYRRTINVTNSSGTALTNYQIKVALNSSTPFDFDQANTDGSDLRFAASDEVTKISFWFEKWNPTVDSAEIWVKVPSIPIGGTTIYLYYGAPIIPPLVPVETPPSGPYTKDPGNPIIPIGVPVGRTSLLAENIVYDDVTQHYWMVLTDQTSGSQLALVYSDDPTNPVASWYWSGYVNVGSAIAPHIMEYNNTWYIFYGDRAHGGPPYPIAVATSTNVNGPYTYVGAVLQAGASGTWEDYRVDEPYVFQRSSDGKWILIYMADSGGNVEQVGYAEADNILGPYTKFGGNPCIPFGPPGSYDAGTVADPWVYEYYGVYYIGYTVSPTTSSPWQTALATTSDWQTFTKHGIILPRGAEFNSFRGAVTRIGDEYVFSYTGGPSSGAYRLCIATQPVYQVPTDMTSNPDAVFDFYDGFNGTSIDLIKWSFSSGTSTQTSMAGGSLTMTATTTYVRVDGTTPIGLGYVGETRARHPSQGTNNMIMEIGFAASGFTNYLRIVDDFPSITNWQRQSSSAGITDGLIDMSQTSDKNWHVFRVYRNSSGTAGFQIDNNPVETVSTNVPTMNLPPFLMSYGSGNQFIVDWTRVRKYVATEPTTTVGGEVPNPLPVELNSFSASVMGTKVNLRWMTETEVNNYGFEIHRLAVNDINGWTKIGFVQGNGNSNSPKYYSFEDKNLISGKYSYRLKQIDTDGQFEYSKVIEVDLDAPMKYELSQNYPNPFNPVTTIQFSIPEAGEVKLVVYNLLGEQVAELINENKEAGVHTINFNAAELNSGLYIYKLTAGNFSDVKKLMVVK